MATNRWTSSSCRPDRRLSGKTALRRDARVHIRSRDIPHRARRDGGDRPGWIYGHRADLSSPHEILIRGGTIVAPRDGKEVHVPNRDEFVLDVERRTRRRMPWRADAASAPRPIW